MKASVAAILLLLSFAQIGMAQTLVIRDAVTNEPLSQAIVFSTAPAIAAYTSDDGTLNFDLFKEASSLTVRHLGYQTSTQTVKQIIDNQYIILLNPLATEMEAVVVSANRFSQSAADIPYRLTKVLPKDVRLSQPQTAADLLNLSGEVFIQRSQQGGGSPMIRGFATNRLVTTVDGIRMNTAILRAGNSQHVISLDPFALEATEVLFGSGSLLYGSDAIGGVMSFQTLMPRFATSAQKNVHTGSAVGRYSSANQEKTGHVDWRIGSQRWAWVSSVSHHHFGDLRMGTQGPTDYLRKFYVERQGNEDKIIVNPDPLLQRPSGYSQLNVMQKLGFRPNKYLDITYGFHHSQTSSFSRYDRLIEASAAGVPRSAVWNYGPQIWQLHHLEALVKKPTKFYSFFAVRAGRQFTEESRIDRNFSGGNRFRLRTQTEQVLAKTIAFDFEKLLGKRTLYYGAEWVNNEVSSDAKAVDIRNGNPIATPDRYPQAVWESTALYASYQTPINKFWQWQGGLRLNRFSLAADFTKNAPFFPFAFTQSHLQRLALTGSSGFIYTPAADSKLGITASTGFRAPNVDDLGKFFDFAAGEVVVPNPALAAEKSYQLAVNAEKKWGNLAVESAAYATYLHHALVRRPFMVNGEDSLMYNGQLSRVFAIQNAAMAYVTGFYVGATYRLSAAWSVQGRYNYQYGIETLESGQRSRSRHAAPPFGQLKLIYKTKQLTGEMQWAFASQVAAKNLNEEEKQKPALYAKDANGLPYSPAWNVLNIKLLYDVSKYISASVGIENLTNQRYRPYSSGITAAGRNGVVSLRLHW